MLLSSYNKILRHSSLSLLRQPMPPLCQVRNNIGSNEVDEKKALKDMGNKARVIALKTKKTAKKGDLKKILKIAENKKTYVYDVHEHMSVNDICILTGAPKDTLLDVVLSHVGFPSF